MARNRPDGWPTLAPRIVTQDVAGLVAFMARVFAASGELHAGRPAEMRIGDSIVMVSDGGGLRDAMPAFLYLYVDDVDETFARALAAGARPIEDPADMPYGDRRATVLDSWGNLWQMAARLPA